MEKNFNAYEVFEIAEQIERNGGKYYRKAVEIVKDDDAKAFLNDLAKMEDDHEKYFAGLKEKYNLGVDSEFPDIDDQMLMFIRSHAFNANKRPEDKIKPESDLEEIIHHAIDFEKSTIVFFSTIKGFMPEYLGKDKIDSLIAEEVRHVAILNAQMDNLIRG